MAVEVLKFDHVFIVVTDLERSVKWYSDVLGFEEVRRSDVEAAPLEKVIRVSGARMNASFGHVGGMLIELGQYTNVKNNPVPQQPNIGVNGLTVHVKDADEAYRWLKEAGVTIESPPIEFTGRARLFYIQDPDGQRWELVQSLR